MKKMRLPKEKTCKRTLVSVVACGCVVTPVFVIGVVLLGWSSFEFDTIQGNGKCMFLNHLSL